MMTNALLPVCETIVVTIVLPSFGFTGRSELLNSSSNCSTKRTLLYTNLQVFQTTLHSVHHDDEQQQKSNKKNRMDGKTIGTLFQKHDMSHSTWTTVLSDPHHFYGIIEKLGASVALAKFNMCKQKLDIA